MANLQKDKLIVALDFNDIDLVEKLLHQLSDLVDWFKIGKELFTATGPDSVKLLRRTGKKVFLDLKFYDIPTTVQRAVASATFFGVNTLSVHASGGADMMRAANDAASERANSLGISKPSIVGITVLTSRDEDSFQRDFLTQRRIGGQVAYLTGLAQKAGLDGVVASPREVKIIRQITNDNFWVVTPGVRPDGVSTDDQQRIMSPAQAVSEGADQIVVGRPITQAEDPRAATEAILQSMSNVELD